MGGGYGYVGYFVVGKCVGKSVGYDVVNSKFVGKCVGYIATYVGVGAWVVPSLQAQQAE